MNLIREIWLTYTFFGYRKITAFLKNEYGFQVNRKKVQRLMQLTGIYAIYPKPNTSKAGKENKVFPYLLRNLSINKVNMVWMTDITYCAPGLNY